MERDRTVSRIWELATQIADGEAMEVVDVELRREGSRAGRVLRLYLDKEGGPSVDDLGRVSRQLSELLDAHDIVEGSYTLEVSSPGINRPLKKPEHFQRFIGKRVRVRTGAVIAAGSVVHTDVPPWTVVRGNPATVIRTILPGRLRA